MNEVTILHQKAMEFADEARLALMEGKAEIAQSFFEKAYNLEREAVEKFDYEDITGKAILIRSAAALAIEAKFFEPAQYLLSNIKNYRLPKYLSDEVEMLENELKKYIVANEKWIQITGILTYANAENNEIKIQQIENNSITYTIIVPHDLINEIVKLYWADSVIIKGKREGSGAIKMSKIDKAA
jgi:hypothetical protein